MRTFARDVKRTQSNAGYGRSAGVPALAQRQATRRALGADTGGIIRREAPARGRNAIPCGTRLGRLRNRVATADGLADNAIAGLTELLSIWGRAPSSPRQLSTARALARQK